MFTTLEIVNAVSPASGNPICLPLEVTVSPEWQRLATTPKREQAFVDIMRKTGSYTREQIVGSPDPVQSAAAELECAANSSDPWPYPASPAP